MGHYVGDPLAYRPPGQVDGWRDTNDALGNFERRVTGETKDELRVEAAELRRIDEEVTAELADAVAAAEKDPTPDPSELLRDVYVEG
jgi:pyruvate dehydrogenase E1 component alpha subunit